MKDDVGMTWGEEKRNYETDESRERNEGEKRRMRDGNHEGHEVHEGKRF